MVQITEGSFKVDDATLHTKTWLPDGAPKAKFVMVHGFSDHIDRYYDFFPTLASRGIAVYGFDQRGWGKSVRDHTHQGRTGPTSRVIGEVAAFIKDKMAEEPKDAPVFVCGHSMGGGEVLTLCCTAEYEEDVLARVRGWILEAPFIGFGPELKPSWLLLASGRLASHVMPNYKMYRHIPPEDVSRDPEVQKSVADDKLMHNYGTLEGLAHMVDRTEKLGSNKYKLSREVKSIYVLHGTADRLTSFEKSKTWYDRNAAGGKVEDATFKSFEGWAHQLHADFGKEEFYKDVGDWILARCGGGGDNVAATSIPTATTTADEPKTATPAKL